MKNRKRLSMKKFNLNYKLLCVLLFFLSIFAAIVSLSIGRYTNIQLNEIPNILYRAFFLYESGDAEVNVLLNLRLPRIVAALFVGASLAIAGTVFQALFSNPIASPDTLGVTQGTSFGAVIGILFGFSSLGMKATAFVIGFFTVIIVYYLSNKISSGRKITLYLLLIGMIFSSIFQAFISLVKYIADPDNQLPQITYWLMGSFSKVSIEDLLPLIIFFFVGATPLYLIRWKLNILTLPTEEAEALGLNVKVLMLLSILCSTLLTSISTTITGGIAWFALLVPHIVRIIVGNDFKKILPVSAFMGSFVMVIMDTISRSISIQELPISIITSLIGAPLFFIILIFKRRSNL